MMVIKRNRLISIAAAIFLITVLIGFTTFGVTHAWFVKETPVKAALGENTAQRYANGDEYLTGIMGTIAIDLTGNRIINGSDIPIILRVRVIAEFTGSGIPEEDIDISYLINTHGTPWEIRDSRHGKFLVYVGNNDFTADGVRTGYGIISPPDSVVSTILLPGITFQYGVKVTFVAEALQATPKAYKYTANNAYNYETGEGIRGVTSWALD